MEGAYQDKYTFTGVWYDSRADLFRRYFIDYFPLDDAISVFDLKNKKVFLKRYKVEGVTLEDFYIGSKVYILGRMFKIEDFACEDSRRKLQDDMQLVFVMIKPIDTSTVGKILTHLHEGGFRITKMNRTTLELENITYIYRRLLNAPEYSFTVSYMTGQSVYVLQLRRKAAVEKCWELFGDRDPRIAAPGTIRALYGHDLFRNCAHISASIEDALEDVNYVFPPQETGTILHRAGVTHVISFPVTPVLSNCTLCLVKPHAVREGKLGKACQLIDDGGFNVTALNMCLLEIENAAELMAAYKGIIPEYKGVLEELVSGPCVAMEVVSKDSTQNSVIAFRKFVGPNDPAVAKILAPDSIRAQLGTSKIKNAFYCSNLSEDGLLEVEYFFKILYI